MISQVSSDWIANATRNYVAEHRKAHPEMAATVQTINALPLYADWSGGVAINQDHELIAFDWDDAQSAKVETNPHLRFLALVVGSKKYPELASLSPARSESDRNCPVCDGTGIVQQLAEMGVDSNVIHCYCGGAGWLPADGPDPSDY